MPDDRSSSDTLPRSVLAGIGRGLALFLGCFTLLNILGDLFIPGFDANDWWLAIPLVRGGVADAFLFIAAVGLMVIALFPLRNAVMRRVIGLLLVLLMLITLENAFAFYAVRSAGTIHAGFPVPLSLFLAGAIAVIFMTMARPVTLSKGGWVLFFITVATSAVVFPLAQMVCFGKTDYRRRADAIVVLGARVYADGSLSQALADRTRTAIELYHQGYAKTLIFSGGPGDGAIDEPTAMRNFAMGAGVPAEAILLDANGLNTDATVRHTMPMLRERNVRSVLVVSHFYHLPRTKMTYQRAVAMEEGGKQPMQIFTVPAKETYTLRAMPQYMAREVVALWAYYLSPLAGD